MQLKLAVATSLAVTAWLSVQSVQAQPRPDTLARSCAANRQSVDRAGAIVLGTGPHLYDRFVRDRRFCQFDEHVEPAWVPSRDVSQCFVGFRCKNGTFWDD